MAQSTIQCGRKVYWLAATATTIASAMSYRCVYLWSVAEGVWPLETAFTLAHHCITGARKGKFDCGGGPYCGAWLRDGSLAVGGYGEVVLCDTEGMGQMRTPTHNFLPLLLPQCCRKPDCQVGPSWLLRHGCASAWGGLRHGVQ